MTGEPPPPRARAHPPHTPPRCRCADTTPGNQFTARAHTPPGEPPTTNHSDNDFPITTTLYAVASPTDPRGLGRPAAHRLRAWLKVGLRVFGVDVCRKPPVDWEDVFPGSEGSPDL